MYDRWVAERLRNPYTSWGKILTTMKFRTIFAVLLCCCLGPELLAQNQGTRKPLSPEATLTGKVGSANIEIVYCRPSARGRKMLGGNEPYGEVWRTGANAATTFTIDRDVRIEGQLLPAGKYELFTIPGATEWTIIFQKYARQWGAFSYKPENDVLRVNVKAKKTRSYVETFTIDVKKDEVVLEWENTHVAFKVQG